MTKQKQENNNLLYIIIIILLIIVAILTFFIGKKSAITNQNNVTTNQTNNKENNIKTIKSVLVYDDSRCTDCNTKAIIDRLKQIPSLTNANYIIKDYKKDSEVKDFLIKNKIQSLPLFIFDTNDINPNLNPYLNKIQNENKYFVLGGNFNPIAYDKLEKREEKPKKLDAYVMGYCPFGEIALKALPQIRKTFKDDNIDLDIHYIATKIGSGNTAESFQSLHGIPEAEEDIRQLCIKKYYGINKLINYAVERYKNADNYGRITDKPEDAIKALGMDTNKIQKCINSGEGAKLLEEDIKSAQELGINASPTWLANNKYKFGGIRASNIQNQFCAKNPNLKGCKTEIKEATVDNGGSPACGK